MAWWASRGIEAAVLGVASETEASLNKMLNSKCRHDHSASSLFLEPRPP